MITSQGHLTDRTVVARNNRLLSTLVVGRKDGLIYLRDLAT